MAVLERDYETLLKVHQATIEAGCRPDACLQSLKSVLVAALELNEGGLQDKDAVRAARILRNRLSKGRVLKPVPSPVGGPALRVRLRPT